VEWAAHNFLLLCERSGRKSGPNNLLLLRERSGQEKRAEQPPSLALASLALALALAPKQQPPSFVRAERVAHNFLLLCKRSGQE
jgi:hypothetical protein